MKNYSKFLAVLVISLVSFLGFVGFVNAKPVPKSIDIDKAILVMTEPSLGAKAKTSEPAKLYMIEACEAKDAGKGGCEEVAKGVYYRKIVKDGQAADVNNAKLDWLKKDTEEKDPAKQWKKIGGELKFDGGEYKFELGKDGFKVKEDEYKFVATSQLVINPTYTGVNFNNASEVTATVIYNVLQGQTTAYSSLSYTLVQKTKITEITITAIAPISQESPVWTATISAKETGALTTNTITIKWYEGTSATDFKATEMGTNDIFKGGKFYKFVAQNLDSLVAEGFEITKDTKVNYNGTNGVFGPVDYTYAFLDGTGVITVTEGKVKSLTFKIDANKDELEWVLIGYILLGKDDFELTEGSTVITLTATGLEKVNTLKAESYDVKAKFKGQDPTVGTLNVEAAKKEETKKETKEEKNPYTYDNIMYYIISSIVSIGGVSALVFIRKINA